MIFLPSAYWLVYVWLSRLWLFQRLLDDEAHVSLIKKYLKQIPLLQPKVPHSSSPKGNAPIGGNFDFVEIRSHGTHDTCKRRFQEHIAQKFGMFLASFCQKMPKKLPFVR
ncbi:hypothetical protein [Paraburkholderia sp.]|uniref:hypothetical protein n=1 Tax=Paraburkholderia sp. TaxID=1926495 RepID=UPI0025DDFC86|nr:hypothetical protein [Paraburkholderia sp.]